jgi:hypothetical protein
MSGTSWLKLQEDKLKFFAAQVGSVLIDLGFLAFWLFLNHLFKKYIVEWIGPSETEKIVFSVFEIIFAASTLAVTSIFLLGDVKNVFINTFNKGKLELGASKMEVENKPPQPAEQVPEKPEAGKKIPEKSHVADASHR